MNGIFLDVTLLKEVIGIFRLPVSSEKSSNLRHFLNVDSECCRQKCRFAEIRSHKMEKYWEKNFIHAFIMPYVNTRLIQIIITLRIKNIKIKTNIFLLAPCISISSLVFKTSTSVKMFLIFILSSFRCGCKLNC